jgi:peptidylprolyl isomerase
MTNRRLPLFAVAVALFAAGCGGGGKEQPAAAPAARTAAPTAAATEAAPPITARTLPPISKNLSKEPLVSQPEGSPPAQLLIKDVVKGKGAKAKPGDNLTVQYTGYSYSTGSKFDASWDRGAQPFQFPLGAGQVIQGWDKGLVGMRAGGRRELVIPPDLGYGPAGQPPTIAPNETLIFVVDLKKIG